MMKRNYSLFRVALVLATGGAFLLPGSARTQVPPDVRGHYGGFSQSSGNPDNRGPAELNILSQTPGGEFQGSITILGNTHSIHGEVDAHGIAWVSGFGGVRSVKGEGKWQDLTRGGALIFGSYKLASGDQGQVNFLRKFQQPPEPDTPPDIAGFWRGTFENILSLMRGTVEWDVQQDRTETGAPGTGFTGQERIAATPAIQLYQFAGAIDGQGNFVRVGVSVEGFIIEGGKFEAGELTGNSVRNYNTFHPTLHYTVLVGR
jgi:hypothetical protein